MEQTMSQSPVKEKFLHQLAGHSSALQNISPGNVQTALRALDDLDFPTTRTEDWKYTRTGRISAGEWKIINNQHDIDITPFLIPGLDADVIVFVNGFYRDDLSSLSSEHILLTTDWSDETPKSFKNIFQALNIAYSTAAIQLRIAKNAVAQKAIHLLHLTADESAMALPNIHIATGQSSDLHVVESFVTLSGRSLTQRSLDITIGENAKLHLDKIQMEGDENFLLNEENVMVASNGHFTINTLTVDGGWVRNDLNIALDGKNIEANLNGFYLPRKKQLVDNHTMVDHRQPHSNSNELYKGLLNDNSIGVFNGKVYVQQDAQKTNAFQSNSNILLSDDAQMNTKPELEIYADDVKCSHGTTTGQMDENALFYLKSRGLGDESAKKLLATAFVNDVLNKVEKEAVRSYVTGELVKRELLFV